VPTTVSDEVPAWIEAHIFLASVTPTKALTAAIKQLKSTTLLMVFSWEVPTRSTGVKGVLGLVAKNNPLNIIPLGSLGNSALVSIFSLSRK